MATTNPGPSIPSSQAAGLLSSFTTFLTLTLHTLLYHRALYPAATFLTARALNLPVRQSRHPGLCGWIGDSVAAVSAQLRRGAVRRIAVAMHAAESFAVLERWVFDVEAFPAWGDAGMEEEEQALLAAGVEPEEVEDDDDDDDEDECVNWTDVNEALRGALRRVAHAAEMMPPLPAGSTFTLAVELRDEAAAPIGVGRCYIPSTLD